MSSSPKELVCAGTANLAERTTPFTSTTSRLSQQQANTAYPKGKKTFQKQTNYALLHVALPNLLATEALVTGVYVPQQQQLNSVAAMLYQHRRALACTTCSSATKTRINTYIHMHACHTVIRHAQPSSMGCSAYCTAVVSMHHCRGRCA